MSEQNPGINRGRRPRKIQKIMGAATLVASTAGLAGVVLSSEHSSEPKIYQPANLNPTKNGTEVPEGELAPAGETITPVPGHTNEAIIHYGNEPNGETLSPKDIQTGVNVGPTVGAPNNAPSLPGDLKNELGLSTLPVAPNLNHSPEFQLGPSSGSNGNTSNGEVIHNLAPVTQLSDQK